MQWDKVEVHFILSLLAFLFIGIKRDLQYVVRTVTSNITITRPVCLMLTL